MFLSQDLWLSESNKLRRVSFTIETVCIDKRDNSTDRMSCTTINSIRNCFRKHTKNKSHEILSQVLGYVSIQKFDFFVHLESFIYIKI